MKFEALALQMGGRLYFRPHDLHAGKPPRPHEPVQLSRWTQEGRLIRLKKGVYTVADKYRRSPLSALALADPLYRPSYVSLEWALSHHGLISEAVGSLTCVTTAKTARFDNALGRFVYRHIDAAYFFGYTRQERPVPHFLALPEKAVLDFIHLSIPRRERLTEALFIEGYRFQNLHVLRKSRLREMTSRFSVPRVAAGGRIVLDLIGGSR
jgi:hypothetical protein